MTAAALATGNTVVLKPAEQAPGCGLASSRRCAPAACRAGAIALLPGEGEVGRGARRATRDVAHDRLHRLGPGRPGDRCAPRGADARTAQRQLKRVVAEMGGKNCVIVDSDADLDEAVPAIVASAFELRRAEVLGGVARARPRGDADALVERLAGAVGPAGRSGRPTTSPPTCRR